LKLLLLETSQLTKHEIKKSLVEIEEKGTLFSTYNSSREALRINR
jgi:hypothetical protein